ncbi:MAG: hypothetical protein BWY24_00344 [Microgenomates group bacterium ADurb.Bin219]|nr:MAG: hypothetical protein BWY24_00344 [Microgenomates group bacterium ADurb.Bin219]
MKRTIKISAVILNLLQLGLIVNFLTDNSTDNLPFLVFLLIVPLANLFLILGYLSQFPHLGVKPED